MGGVLAKQAEQAARPSARTVLARRGPTSPALRVDVPPQNVAPAPLPSYHPNAPITHYNEPEMEPALLETISKYNMVKMHTEKTTADGSHLAVFIRQRKDEELLEQQVKENSLVVGRGRLSEKDVVKMMESMRLDPETNNPVDVAKQFNLNIHTVVQIATATKYPLVLTDSEGNLYAI